MKLWGCEAGESELDGSCLVSSLRQAVAGQAVVILKMSQAEIGVSCDSGCLKAHSATLHWITCISAREEIASISSLRQVRHLKRGFPPQKCPHPHTRCRLVSSEHPNHPWRKSPASPNCRTTGQSKRPSYPRCRACPRPSPSKVGVGSRLPRHPSFAGNKILILSHSDFIMAWC